MPVKFIAEISSNHNGDLDRCLEFVKSASAIGCWGVKFQLFQIEKLFTKEVLDRSEDHRNRKNWELPLEFLPEIKRLCGKLNLKFGCTPFYLEAVDELEPFVDFYKVASYELLWLDLFRKILKTGKPIHFSTGIANMTEIQNTLEVISAYPPEEIVIYHCTSSYPTPIEDVNLKAIETIKKKFGQYFNEMNLKIGLSDHSVNSGVINRAVNRFEAEYIEFHLDLDEKGYEFNSGHCWLPDAMKELMKNISDGLAADGDGVKSPRPSEMDERNWRADPEDGIRPLKSIRGFES